MFAKLIDDVMKELAENSMSYFNTEIDKFPKQETGALSRMAVISHCKGAIKRRLKMMGSEASEILTIDEGGSTFVFPAHISCGFEEDADGKLVKKWQPVIFAEFTQQKMDSANSLLYLSAPTIRILVPELVYRVNADDTVTGHSL